MNKTQALKQVLYLLPLCLLAIGISLFSVETIVTDSFADNCHDRTSPYRFYDFCSYYCGGKIAASPDRTQLYDGATQHRYLATVRSTDPLKSDSVIMLYAPFVACLLIPLTALPPDLAFALYYIGSIAAYFAGFALLIKMSALKTVWWQKSIIAFALLGTVPVFITAMLGQMSCYLFLFVSAYFYCLYRGKDLSAGLLLALTSFKPHYALFWAVPALGQRKWKVLGVTALAELALLVLAALVLGWQTVANYPAAILRGDSLSSNSEAAILMICLRGLLMSFTGSSWVYPLTTALMAAGWLMTLFLWIKQASNKADQGNNFHLLAAATVILCLFTSVHTYVYDGLLLVAPAVLLLGSKAPAASSAHMRFIIATLLATPYLQWLGMVVLPNHLHRSLPTSLILLALTAAMLMLFACGLRPVKNQKI